MNLIKKNILAMISICALSMMAHDAYAGGLSDKATPDPTLNGVVIKLVSEDAKHRAVPNVDWVNCRNAGGSAEACGLPTNNEGEPAIPTKYQADADAMREKYTYKEDPAAVREQGIAAVEREAAQNGGKTHPIDWQNCMSLGGGSRCGTPMTEADVEAAESQEDVSLNAQGCSAVDRVNGAKCIDFGEDEGTSSTASQGCSAADRANGAKCIDFGEDEGTLSSASGGCNSSTGAKCIDLGDEDTSWGSDSDGYGAGDDGYVTSADTNYRSSSFDPTGYDRVLSGTGNRAGSWIEGIKVRASQQAAMGTPGCNPCSGPAVSSGGGGLLGGLMGGSGSSLFGFDTSSLTSALKVAEKLGVNTSGLKEGLAIAGKASDMANNVGSMVSGASAQVATLGNTLSGTTGKISGAVSSMGNLNLGSLTKAGSSLTGAASSLTSGNFSVASAKEALASVKSGVSTVNGIVNQGKSAVTTAQNAVKTVGSNASTLSNQLRGIVTPPPGG